MVNTQKEQCEDRKTKSFTSEYKIIGDMPKTDSAMSVLIYCIGVLCLALAAKLLGIN